MLLNHMPACCVMATGGPVAHRLICELQKSLATASLEH